MNEKVEVKLDFINKRNELKHVQFYMDKKTYEILFDKSISEEVRQKYLVEEYHEYERERYYNRKFVPFDIELVEKFYLFGDSQQSFEQCCNEEIIEAINKLSPRQQEIIKKVYFENKKQIEVAKELNISKEAVSKTITKAITNLKKILKSG